MAEMDFRREHAKKEWKKISTPDYISSDESGLEEEDDALVEHQLPAKIDQNGDSAGKKKSEEASGKKNEGDFW